MADMVEPISVRAWACGFGCGRNVLTHNDRMWRHQCICNWNPANRACATCKHWHKEKGEWETGAPSVSECLILKKDLKEKLFNQCLSWEPTQGGEHGR